MMTTLLTALVGAFVVTRLVTSSVRERFFNQLVEASRVASDAVMRREQDHLSDLRLMVFAEGVSEALENEDQDALSQVLWPLALNGNLDAVSVLNPEGREILTLAVDPESGQYNGYHGADFSGYPVVSEVIAKRIDHIGDKYAGFIVTQFGPFLYTSTPVHHQDDNLQGVILVGTSLENLLIEVKSQALADLIVYDSDGLTLMSSFSDFDFDSANLSSQEIEAIGSEESTVKQINSSNRAFQASISPLLVREKPLGYLAVVLPSNYIVQTEATSRNTFSLIFSAATLVVILLGYFIAESIAKPLLRLREVTKAVAKGDLKKRSGLKRSDEIGELAAAFDLMTFRLGRRTAQAERLYVETIQRYEELQEINARLQFTQQQLIQSEKLAAVGQLTAGIVHDVKNPLTVIKGLAEELQEENGIDPQSSDLLKVIYDSAGHANRIVTDLLKFARQSEPVMKSQDLVETVQTTLRLIDYLARKGSVKIETVFPDRPVMAVYDATQIEQVLVNLIQNAIQAMPDGGTLGVRVYERRDQVVVMVEDSGVGISKENLRRIFDPFFTTKVEGEGTGLGLSVSFGIVAAHNGRIEVDSLVGKGTRFIVVLPIQNSE
jgi:signal transduction histidine kinase